MNILLFSDLHLRKNNLEECSLILEEIRTLCKEYSINVVYDLGDTFDTYYPSIECIDLFANFLKELNKHVIILAAKSHESETSDRTILTHFRTLTNYVSVVSEYKEDKELYLGHFTLQESKYNYNSKQSKKDYKDYKKVYLGHQHSYEKIDNITHIGSCIYDSFAEAKDTKAVIVIQNYKQKDEKELIIPLKSVYPMKDMHFVEKAQQKASSTKKTAKNTLYVKDNAELLDLLDSYDKITKVRVTFNTFKQWKEFLSYLDKYVEKFNIFKVEKNFDILKEIKIAKKQNINLLESLEKWLKEKEVDEDIQKILLKEIK